MSRRLKRASRYFQVGERIQTSGIYHVFHSGHRVSHEVTLLAGETFPRCAACGSEVRFELVARAQQAVRDADFRIRLYEIPHPKMEAPKAEEKEEAEKTG